MTCWWSNRSKLQYITRGCLTSVDLFRTIEISIPSLILSIPTEEPRFLYPHSVFYLKPQPASYTMVSMSTFSSNGVTLNETNLSFAVSLTLKIIAFVEDAPISRTTLSLLIMIFYHHRSSFESILDKGSISSQPGEGYKRPGGRTVCA